MRGQTVTRAGIICGELDVVKVVAKAWAQVRVRSTIRKKRDFQMDQLASRFQST
jgi:hypothetical protein